MLVINKVLLNKLYILLTLFLFPAAGITAQITAAVEEAGAQAAALRQDIPPLKSNIVGYPESEEEERNSEQVPEELVDLRRDLNILRNELKSEVNLNM